MDYHVLMTPKSSSTLDLPEPEKSRFLAAMGMTEAEYIAHRAACEAIYAEKDAEVAAGLVKPATWPEEGFDPVPVLVERGR
jgi:hypothetical protein